MLLILMQILFSGSFDFIRQNLFLIPAITVASFLRVFVSAFTMLALSSLSKSSRYVAMMYAGSIFFTNAVFGVMRFVAGSTRVAWISISANLDQVTDAIFRRPPRYETPVIVALLVLLGPGGDFDLGARAARARRRGRVVSAADRQGRGTVEVVRPGHRPEQRHGRACRRALPACWVRTARARARS